MFPSSPIGKFQQAEAPVSNEDCQVIITALIQSNLKPDVNKKPCFPNSSTDSLTKNVIAKQEVGQFLRYRLFVRRQKQLATDKVILILVTVEPVGTSSVLHPFT